MKRKVRVDVPPLRRARIAVLPAAELEFDVGAIVGVVGLNGSGKTTLMLSMSRLLAGCQATIRTRIGEDAFTVVDAVGFAPQQPALPDWATVEQVTRLWATTVEALDSAMPALRIGELSRRRVRALSGGQRQALSVALALSTGAEVLLLDEPFAALDLRRRRGLMQILSPSDVRAERPTVFLSSQAGADLYELCTDFVIVADGAYAFVGTREQLLRSGTQSPQTMDAFERTILQIMDGVSAEPMTEAGVTITCEFDARARP